MAETNAAARVLEKNYYKCIRIEFEAEDTLWKRNVDLQKGMLNKIYNSTK